MFQTSNVLAKEYGYTMTTNGADVKYIYSEPSHHYWMDDETIFDNGDHIEVSGAVS